VRSLIYQRVQDRRILQEVVGHYTVLATIRSSISQAYRTYVTNKASPTIIPLTVTTDQKHAFELAYKGKLSSAGLDWINTIYYNGLSSCPFCGGDGARTIEHYLPQECYPEFSVYSLNLMPSCGSCNTKRNDANAYGAPIPLLHPFFDKNLLDNISLFTSVTVISGIPGFELTYDRTLFNATEQVRIDHHLDTSVDTIAFFNRTWASLEALKCFSEKCATVQDFRVSILDEHIHVCESTRDLNSWHHTLCKGLKKLNNQTLALLLEESLGRRL